MAWGVAARTLAGQEESGDRQAIKLYPHGALVAVVDGLGHGDEAAAAAKIAVATLEAHPGESIIPLLRRCHENLRSTRGVVMSLASFNVREGTMTWLGVGNVEGILLRGDPAVSPRYESLLLRGGVVGGQLPALYASILPVVPGDTLIFATDGIRSKLADHVASSDVPQRTADTILARSAKVTDDALVLVARYCGKAG
ncbi:MAG: SpoIIE family protein phosphatase [Candidatus Rokubacteria bacterium]|nr:SpoIIE family protein phosphatase [Candidatus Rokubacteria bacterium]